jgi:hypothetical protein
MDAEDSSTPFEILELEEDDGEPGNEEQDQNEVTNK